MEKLYELMGTKYICDWHVGKLQEVLSTHKEIDLWLCKFTNYSEKVLRDFYGKCKFINSRDKRLNNILEANEKVVTYKCTMEKIPIPIDFNSQDEILHFVKNANTSVIYTMENYIKNRSKCISLAIILTMRRPEVIIDLGIYATDVFKQVRIDWLKYFSTQSEYCEVIGTTIVRRIVKDGKVYIAGVGWVDELIYINKFIVLPAIFGSENITKNSEFKEVWDNAVMNLFSSIEEEKKMKDYIEILE